MWGLMPDSPPPPHTHTPSHIIILIRFLALPPTLEMDECRLSNVDSIVIAHFKRSLKNCGEVPLMSLPVPHIPV